MKTQTLKVSKSELRLICRALEGHYGPDFNLFTEKDVKEQSVAMKLCERLEKKVKV